MHACWGPIKKTFSAPSVSFECYKNKLQPRKWRSKIFTESTFKPHFYTCYDSNPGCIFNPENRNAVGVFCDCKQVLHIHYKIRNKILGIERFLRITILLVRAFGRYYDLHQELLTKKDLLDTKTVIIKMLY